MRVDYIQSDKGWSWVIFTIQNTPFAASLVHYKRKSDAQRAVRKLKQLFK